MSEDNNSGSDELICDIPRRDSYLLPEVFIPNITMKNKAFSKKQLNDLATIVHFIPEIYKKKGLLEKITEEDKRAFLDISERGIYPKEKTIGLEMLQEGKKWRGTHIGMYEEGVLDGSVPYCVLLGAFANAEYSEVK